MSVIAAIEAILKGDQQEILIPCADEKNRNVVRTTAFRARSKMEKSSVFKVAVRDIGITNEDLNGYPCVKIYLRKDMEMLVKNEKGEWVQFVSDPTTNPEAIRIFDLMIQDKRPTEEILDVMQEYDWSESFILDRIGSCRDADTEEPLIPQDMKDREQELKDMLAEE